MAPLPYGPKMKVALRDCRFFAYHGVMERERRAGNDFKVSLEVTYTPGDPLSDRLDLTISYADLYEITRQEMNRPAALLETVAARIATAVATRWPHASHVAAKIVKVAPPIEGCTGEAEVTFELYR